MSFLPDTQSIKQAPASASWRGGGVPPEKAEAGEQLAKYEIESVVGKAAQGFTAGLGRRPFAKQKAAVAKHTLPMTPAGSVQTKDGTVGREASSRMLSFSPDGQTEAHNKHRKLQNTGNRRTAAHPRAMPAAAGCPPGFPLRCPSLPKRRGGGPCCSHAKGPVPPDDHGSFFPTSKGRPPRFLPSAGTGAGCAGRAARRCLAHGRGRSPLNTLRR